MDSFASTAEPRVPPTEGGERGQQLSERWLGKGAVAAESLSIVELEPRPPRSLGRKVAFAALAACVCGAGLLVYAFREQVSEKVGPSVTEALPGATSPRSAVIDLPPPDLLKPLSPEEATRENAERPFADRLDIAARPFVLRTDAEDRSRALTCLAQAVYYEAAGEGVDGGRAVAQVVLNRLRHPGYPSTVCGVVYEGGDRVTGCQFSFVCDGSMQRIPIPWLWTRSRQIAEQALAGKVFGPIGHATHYHADYVLPYWADSLDKSVQIGRHIFYRLRSLLGEGAAFSQRYAGAEPAVREPGAAMVIPQAPETAQLASALISDGLKAGAGDAEKAAPSPTSPLLVDGTRGTLLADAAGTPQQPAKRRIASDCTAGADGKKLAPLGANDMRTSIAGAGC